MKKKSAKKKKKNDKEEKIKRESNVKIAMSSLKTLNHKPLHEVEEWVSFLLFE